MTTELWVAYVAYNGDAKCVKLDVAKETDKTYRLEGNCPARHVGVIRKEDVDAGFVQWPTRSPVVYGTALSTCIGVMAGLLRRSADDMRRDALKAEDLANLFLELA